MFIQGNLQIIFDALYSMGIINTSLKGDWAPLDKSMKQNQRRVNDIISVVNKGSADVETLVENLRKLDQESLLFLTMEVAREFLDFEDRKVLH